MNNREDYQLIQTYIRDINDVLRDASNEDILNLFKKLYNKEQSFAKKLQSTGSGRKIYMMFIKKIVESQGGIKSARSYFRARQESYLETVNEAIKKVNPKLMYEVPINYRFCLFATQTLVTIDPKLSELFSEIKTLREEIINKHLYLSLNRAKIHRKNSHGRAEFEDLIQIANEALVVAVDKYVMDGEESTFHQMALGRMIGNLIANGSTLSATTIGGHAHKKLYQIRKLLQKQPNLTNDQVGNILDIAREEVDSLIAATSYSSLDEELPNSSKSGTVDSVRRIDTIVSDDWEKEFEAIEKEDALSKLEEGFKNLSIIQRKVLLLKGVKF